MKTTFKIALMCGVLASCGPVSMYYKPSGYRHHELPGRGAQGCAGGQRDPAQPAGLLPRPPDLPPGRKLLLPPRLLGSGQHLHRRYQQAPARQGHSAVHGGPRLPAGQHPALFRRREAIRARRADHGDAQPHAIKLHHPLPERPMADRDPGQRGLRRLTWGHDLGLKPFRRNLNISENRFASHRVLPLTNLRFNSSPIGPDKSHPLGSACPIQVAGRDSVPLLRFRHHLGRT